MQVRKIRFARIDLEAFIGQLSRAADALPV
jgi:hypothetical protein